MNIQQKRVVKVLENMINLAKDCEFHADDFSERLELILEDMANNDAFGSEMQCDPRGDGRNGNFTMLNVEGIDL